MAAHAKEYVEEMESFILNAPKECDEAKAKFRDYFNTHRKSKLAHGGYWRHDYKYALAVIKKIDPDRLIENSSTSLIRVAAA
ncbi:MAG: hypothetical protein K5695_00025 [Oscillospiraceae bacterium]|nr:hypothetical protein [Oscillospiraceae bacterium]